MDNTIKLLDLFKYYKGYPQQEQAIGELEQLILDSIPKALNKENSWYQTWSEPYFQNTWEGACTLAALVGSKYPKCTAAQWALESNWGQDLSGKNNYFGLKGESGTERETKEYIDGKLGSTDATFLDFPSALACFQYLIDRWYKDYKTYKGVNRATSSRNCARLLVKEGYATDPEYASKLIQLIKENSKPKLNPVADKCLIQVPYEYQLDNASGTGYRECFSSTCAMIAKYYKRVKSDDEYNKLRSNYGDTTDSQSQLKTLESLDLNPQYLTNGTETLLEQELTAGRPVAVGWLHKGWLSAPSGGGHWSCCIGYTKKCFIFNDPNGKADMRNGGYISHKALDGYKVKYSRKEWLNRWEVDGKGTGWCIVVRPENGR